MRLRIAKPNDATEIASLHYRNRSSDGVGIFSQVSKLFLKNYYSICLNHSDFVALVAERDGNIVGFASGTLDAGSHYKNLKAKSWRLVIPAMQSAVMKPSIIRMLYKRLASFGERGRAAYVNQSGARGEYWVWDSEDDKSMLAGYLNNTNLNLMKILGVKILKFEVDRNNISAVEFSVRNGAKVDDEIELDDGRTRMMMSYDLTNMFKLKR